MLTREQMAMCVAYRLRDGYYANLRIGIFTLVANYILDGMDVTLQSENGLLSMGPFPTEGEIDTDTISAGKQTVTAYKGMTIFDSVQSFAIIYGGHVDLAVLGAFEVDVNGNIAFWMILGKMVEGMSGAADLVTRTENIIMVITHASKSGESKLLPARTLPLTDMARIKRVPTDLALLETADGAFILRERTPGISADEIVTRTTGKLTVPENVPEMQFS